MRNASRLELRAEAHPTRSSPRRSMTMSEHEFQQVLFGITRLTRGRTRAAKLHKCKRLYYKTTISVKQRHRVLQEMDKIAPLRGPGGFAKHLPSDLSVPGPEE